MKNLLVRFWTDDTWASTIFGSIVAAIPAYFVPLPTGMPDTWAMHLLAVVAVVGGASFIGGSHPAATLEAKP